MKRLSLALALISLAAVLFIGVPLFLRTPVWVDVTYHDLSAWNILHDGVHYRDVFETNLPGMVWLHALLRPAIGWSHEAIRVVDLVVFGLTVLHLICMIRPVGQVSQPVLRDAELSQGQSHSGQVSQPVLRDAELSQGQSHSGQVGKPVLRVAVWFLVAAFVFYLFETEFIHCQRDGWMLLPAVVATILRVRQCATPRAAVWSVAEGLLWGLAVWIKPHVLVPALFVWFVSLRFQSRRNAITDAIGMLVGGLIAGGFGAAWLVRTGAWQPMWDVLLNWNQEYYTWSWESISYKVRLVPGYFPPFSLLHLVAVPLAVIALFRRDPRRALLAALYLGWLAQATIIQKEFDYAHYPPTLIGLALLAAHRWPVGPIFLVWCLTAGIVNEVVGESEWLVDLKRSYPLTVRTVLPDHAIADRERLRLWPRSWHDDSWELKDRLTFYHHIHCAPKWTDLQRVADFLATKDLHDRELICWHDSTHPLYVWLGIKPGIRYPHVITAMKFNSKREQIRQETFSSPARYVVSDLVPVEYTSGSFPSSPPGPTDSLPPGFPSWGKDVYPWNQPVVFRAGRYVVHEIKEPRGEIVFPMPFHLD